jgi:transcriptional/translational regulatory protein YebC/TACO1
MSLVLDAGADDMQSERGRFTVTCDPASFQKVQEALAKNNITTETAEITMVAKMNVDVDAETARKITKLLMNLDDHDDVQNVHCNVNMSPEVLAELENE